MATSVAATTTTVESTSVKSTAAVTATVEPTTTMEAAAAPEAPAAKAFMVESAASKTVTIPATSAPAAAVKTAAIPAAVVPIPTIPRAHSYKHTIDEPFWPVIAIRRASIRVIVIISIGANRRWANISRAIVAGAYAHADNHSLRTRKRRAIETNAK
jgi:hypothetical protein